LRLDSPHS